ncbi:MAG: hypothetical protein ACYDEF_02800 [Methanosarcina sp.]
MFEKVTFLRIGQHFEVSGEACKPGLPLEDFQDLKGLPTASICEK